MRTIKELLILSRDNMESLFANTNAAGLCSIPYWLRRQGTITDNEEFVLQTYIEDHTPKLRALYRFKRYKNVQDPTGNGYSLGRFWWTPKEIAPRIKWLNRHINKL